MVSANRFPERASALVNRRDWPLLDLLTANRLPQRVDRVFCSELVAEVYKRLGVMCRSVRSSRYVPGDFGVDQPSFLRDARLSAPLLLKA